MRISTLAVFLCVATPAFSETKIVVHGPHAVLQHLPAMEDRVNEKLWELNSGERVRFVKSESQRPFFEFCQEINAPWRYEDGQVDIFITYRNFGASSASSCWELGNKGLVELTLGHYAPLVVNNWYGDSEAVLTGFGELKTNDVNFTTSEIFTALSSEVLVDGVVQGNPYYSWSEINSDFPSDRIHMSLGHGSSFGALMFAGCKETGTYDQMLADGLSEEEALEKCQSLHPDPDRARRIDTETALRLVAIERTPAIVGTESLERISNWYRQWNTDFFVSKLNDSYPSERHILDGTYPGGGSLRAYFRTSDINDQFQDKMSPIEMLADLLAGESLETNTPGANNFGLQIDPRWSGGSDIEAILATKAKPCPKPKNAKCPTPVGIFYPEQ